MAEPYQKRPRDESEGVNHFSDSKRQNSVSEGELLQEEELSSPSSSSAVFQQQDLSAAFDFDFLPAEEVEEIPGGATAAACSSSDEDDGVNSVMRHLLEASDDELGLPNCTDDEALNTADVSCSENFPIDFGNDGLWEFEDVAAGYYTMLQSELFM
ncbi:uncharacterized protein LOC127263816 [Andrographis paniculata]|uniref:uncharacterized protein LOC127263816 n=1 Tax=Andrographis paniculata TaxID=175694 RepID=UPI0021E6E49F|nr:uncharacterized protein LOC127263816 [Andrographis paniculata]